MWTAARSCTSRRRELLLTALSGYLPGGGSADGELRITNWLGEAPSSAPAKSPTVVGAVTTANKTAIALGAVPTAKASLPQVYAHAYLITTVNAIPLRTIMQATETARNYGDLGFDTAVTGPVTVQWGGPEADARRR